MSSATPHSPLRWEPLAWGLFVVVTGALYVAMGVGEPHCSGDCGGYLRLMGIGSLVDYVVVWASMWRSWFVPVFFSMFGAISAESARSIVVAQVVLAFSSWMLFNGSISWRLGGRAGRVFFAIGATFPYAHQNWLFGRYLLSDSIALSTLLLFLAAVIAMEPLSRRTRPDVALFTVVVLGAFAAGARDANAMLVALGGVYAVSMHRTWLGRRVTVVMAVALLAVVANQVACGSVRHRANLANLLAGFVLPDAERRAFFVERGMPAGSAPEEPLIAQPWGAADYHAIRRNQWLAGVNDDQVTAAAKIYPRWLLSHPGYVAGEVWTNAGLILGQPYDPSPEWERPIDARTVKVAPQDFVPGRMTLVVALAAIVALLLPVVRRRLAAPELVAMLVAGGLANAVLGFFADLWEPSEMMRHALIGSILCGVGLCLLGVMLVVRNRDVSPPGA